MNQATEMAPRNDNAVSRTGHPDADTALRPPVDVIEDAAGITLYADLPGVSREKLNLQIDADTLIIEGEADLSLPEGLEAGHTEVSVPRYRRVFSLSRDMDSEQVTAELKHGVLKLTIPRAEHAQPRKIEVSTN
jgi:HSP20 family protein